MPGSFGLAPPPPQPQPSPSPSHCLLPSPKPTRRPRLCLPASLAHTYAATVASPQPAQHTRQPGKRNKCACSGSRPSFLCAPLQERALLKKLKGNGDGAVDIFFRQASQTQLCSTPVLMRCVQFVTPTGAARLSARQCVCQSHPVLLSAGAAGVGGGAPFLMIPCAGFHWVAECATSHVHATLHSPCRCSRRGRRRSPLPTRRRSRRLAWWG